MKSTQMPSDKERAERQQLDEALAQSQVELDESVANGARVPRLASALPGRRERTSMSFYDEYAQAARDEPQLRPRKSNIDDLGAMSFGPGDAGRWDPTRRNGRETEPPANGYGQRSVGPGYANAPRGSRAGSRAAVPAVLMVNDSVFTLLSEQVKELRQRKLELQDVVATQEEKISELISLVHQLTSQLEDLVGRSSSQRQGAEGDEQ